MTIPILPSIKITTLKYLTATIIVAISHTSFAAVMIDPGINDYVFEGVVTMTKPAPPFGLPLNATCKVRLEGRVFTDGFNRVHIEVFDGQVKPTSRTCASISLYTARYWLIQMPGSGVLGILEADLPMPRYNSTITVEIVHATVNTPIGTCEGNVIVDYSNGAENAPSFFSFTNAALAPDCSLTGTLYASDPPAGNGDIDVWQE